MIEVQGKEGKEGISAKVIQHSKSSYTGKELITFEIEYPRFILAEVNTHCMLEKNSASSRAVPIKTQCELIRNNPAMPVHWGKNQAGMVAEQELDDLTIEYAVEGWKSAMIGAVMDVEYLEKLGVHKQIANRISEPWQRMKTVISGTEWANFFYLRNHPDAQPEFQELARVMQEAMQQSKPMELVAGEWHVPYVERERNIYGGALAYFTNGVQLSPTDARIVSASCCAQVSYRKNDDTLEKARQVFERLNIGSSDKPAHASPTTHQGTPIKYDTIDLMNPMYWPDGISHMSRNGKLWSGKFQDFIQYRKLIPNEAKW
jgi:hypothetical protein